MLDTTADFSKISSPLAKAERTPSSNWVQIIFEFKEKVIGKFSGNMFSHVVAHAEGDRLPGPDCGVSHAEEGGDALDEHEALADLRLFFKKQ